MANTQYGFVDTGDALLVRPTTNINIIGGGTCDNCEEAMSKIDEIIKGAPQDADTFVEVADMLDSIRTRLSVLEGNSGDVCDSSKYAKKTDLCRYLTKEEALAYVTDIDLLAELAKLDSIYVRKGSEVTKEELDTALELKANLENVYLKDEVDEKLDKIKSDTINEITEMYIPIDVNEIDRIYDEI